MNYETMLMFIVLPTITQIIKWILDNLVNWFADLHDWWNSRQPTVVLTYTNYRTKDRIIFDNEEYFNNEYIEAVLDFIKEKNPNVVHCVAKPTHKLIEGTCYRKMLPIYIPHGTCKFRDFTIKSSSGKNTSDSVTSKVQKLIISHPISHDAITDFLNEAHLAFVSIHKNDDFGKRYFFNKKGDAYEKLIMNTDVTFDKIFFEGKDVIIDSLNKLRVKLIPKFTMLLHGKPGCGKSSIIKAISNYMEYHVIEVKLANIKTDNELRSLFFNQEITTIKDDKTVRQIGIPSNKRLFILEDIDADNEVVFTRSSTNNEKKEKKEDEEKKEEKKEKKKEKNTSSVTLSGILNILDGVLQMDGSIVIMTTNHPEKLDPALIRPGCISMNLKLDCMTTKNALMLIRQYYTDWDVEIPNEIFTPASIEAFCRLSKNKEELQSYLGL